MLEQRSWLRIVEFTLMPLVSENKHIGDVDVLYTVKTHQRAV